MPVAPGGQPVYDPECQRCRRLAAFLGEVSRAEPGYFCRPVPPFGAVDARLVVVGLAPGRHGANRTGRPFTGDYAGVLLYRTLFDFGFASAPASTARDDGLELLGCRITNAVKCLPPANRPTPAEVAACNGYLAAELRAVPAGGAILALGRVAHDAALRAIGARLPRYPFAHGAMHRVDRLALFDSYHCSRYNTNTRRLTTAMFRDVFAAVARYLGSVGPSPES